MYSWYNKAAICYAYLDDVSIETVTDDNSHLFTGTLWATRGWTLQELLAPSEVIFYSQNWSKLGSKITLHKALSKMTGIDEDFLTGKRSIEVASIAKKMSWAARRQTTRPEDIAYCLMGIFLVNMPMLYGEGDKAFLRLQEEIMKHSDDQSLFAWTTDQVQDDTYHGLLAKHPSYFKHSNSIIPYQDREVRQPFSMSNRGLQIELYLNKLEGDRLYAAALDCPVPPLFADGAFLTIYLEQLPGAELQYARVKVGRFGEIHKRGNLQTIFVRQNVVVSDVDGIYPNHMLQLRRFDGDGEMYRVAKVLFPRSMTRPPPVKSSKATSVWGAHGDVPPTCTVIRRAEKAFCCALSVSWREKEAFVIMLGSSGGYQVGFCGVGCDTAYLENNEPTRELEAMFEPIAMGSRLTIGYHSIRVTAEPLIVGGAKYYMIDVRVEAIERPPDLLDAILDKVDDIVATSKDTKSRGIKKLRDIFNREK